MFLFPKKVITSLMVTQMLIRFLSQGGRRPAVGRMVAQAFSTTQITPPALSTSRRSFHTTLWVRNTVVEEDLDSALEDILGDAFPSQPNGVSLKAQPAVNGNALEITVSHLIFGF